MSTDHKLFVPTVVDRKLVGEWATACEVTGWVTAAKTFYDSFKNNDNSNSLDEKDNNYYGNNSS
jgi:hypothetical protein